MGKKVSGDDTSNSRNDDDGSTGNANDEHCHQHPLGQLDFPGAMSTLDPSASTTTRRTASSKSSFSGRRGGGQEGTFLNDGGRDASAAASHTIIGSRRPAKKKPNAAWAQRTEEEDDSRTAGTSSSIMYVNEQAGRVSSNKRPRTETPPTAKKMSSSRGRRREEWRQDSSPDKAISSAGESQESTSNVVASESVAQRHDNARTADDKSDGKATPPNRTPLPLDFEPNPYTVVIGKGPSHNNTVGNQRLRVLASTMLPRYTNAQTRSDKTKVVTNLIETVKGATPAGAFVMLKAGRYWEVSDHAAREKIGYIIRDLLHHQYRSSSQSKSEIRKQRRKLKELEKQEEEVPNGGPVLSSSLQAHYQQLVSVQVPGEGAAAPAGFPSFPPPPPASSPTLVQGNIPLHHRDAFSSHSAPIFFDGSNQQTHSTNVLYPPTVDIYEMRTRTSTMTVSSSLPPQWWSYQHYTQQETMNIFRGGSTSTARVFSNDASPQRVMPSPISSNAAAVVPGQRRQRSDELIQLLRAPLPSSSDDSAVIMAGAGIPPEDHRQGGDTTIPSKRESQNEEKASR